MSSRLLPELGKFKWANRDVYIAYDSDIIEKERVQQAEDRLSKELGSRGANVLKVRLPSVDEKKVGLDDFLLDHSDDEFEELLVSSDEAKSAYQRPRLISDILLTNYPDTEWVWKNLILKGEVNLLYGEGGVGKSLLALHLAISVALGEPLFDLDVTQMPVLALFEEDGPAEVHRRAKQIYRDYRLSRKENLPVHLWCKPDEDSLLAVIDDNGEIHEQPRLTYLRTELERMGKSALIILDSMADLFAMNENLRLPVNAAMKRVLGSLCKEYGATVLVLAHPSKASKIDGSNYSGSTAFNNAVRQRLTLSFEPQETGYSFDGPPPRKLEVAKSNYGSAETMSLWFYGCSIELLPRPEEQNTDFLKQLVLQEILKCINNGINVVISNGNSGDARTPRDIATSISSQHGNSVHWKTVRQLLLQLQDEEKLKYIPARKDKRPHTRAHFERGPKCPK